MHNRIGFNRLGRKSSHRKALQKNMVTSLLKYERIQTTKAKAKEVRRTAEKLITRAKVDSVHNRRIAAKTVQEKDVLNKLFTEIGVKFKDRAGGYTRILKLGQRSGDAAEVVILELVEDEAKKAAAPKRSRKKAPAKTQKKAEKPAEEKKEEAKAEEAPEAEEKKAEKPAEAKKAEEAPKAEAKEAETPAEAEKAEEKKEEEEK